MKFRNPTTAPVSVAGSVLHCGLWQWPQTGTSRQRLWERAAQVLSQDSSLQHLCLVQVQDLGGTLLEVEVGEKAAWKDPGHVFRQAAGLELTCIPTLMRWSGHTCTSRLDAELENAKTIEEIDSLVRMFCQ